MFRSWRQSVRELGERVERLEGELGRLNMENADLKSQLKERDARIAKLESVLEESRRAGKRQAAPFSKDKPKRDPKKPGRKPGSKYGRQAVRAISVPDKTFEAPCPEQCPCGGKVGAEGSIDLYQVDIPPIQPETWKFVVGHGHCQECGRRVRGQHPLLISKAFEVGTVHFGPRLLAFAAFQKMICGVSYDKIRLGFEQMLGFPVARSTLCRAMQRLARRAKPTRDALVEALRASPVVYADETGWKQGGRRVWLWVFTNLRETVYEILPGRGFEQAASVLGKNYAGTLGVDGWAPYRCFKEATLQTCYNHLLHRCHELLETATRGAVRFPRLVKAILRHALALRDRRDAGEISPHGLRVAKGLLQAKMNRLLHGRFTNPANQRFAKHLRRYRDNLFVFLDRADVEATNYPAEQDIRIAVVNRKTCGGGNRTAKGAQAQSILMSVLQSCRHKGIRVIDIVTSILRAPDNTPSPWSTQSGKQLRSILSSNYLVQEGVNELFVGERHQIARGFADANVADGKAELFGYRDHDAAFGGAVHFREDDAGDAERGLELLRLAQPVAADGGIHDEERLVRRIGNEARGHALDLGELIHQRTLGVEPSRRVDKNCIDTPTERDLDAFVNDGSRIPTRCTFNEVDADPLGPNGELFLRRRPERIRSHHERRLSRRSAPRGELGHSRRFADAVDADNHRDSRWRARNPATRRHGSQDPEKLLSQNIGAPSSALTHRFQDRRGRRQPDIG